jgi:hypothetical protein
MGPAPLQVHKRTPISVKWNEDPSNENQGEAENVVGEERDPIKTGMTVSVENINSRREEDETAMKASTRCQMIPVIRRDDFFVNSYQQKTVKVKKEGKMGKKTKTPCGIDRSSKCTKHK